MDNPAQVSPGENERLHEGEPTDRQTRDKQSDSCCWITANITLP